jgi:hypothetical protein
MIDNIPLKMDAPQEDEYAIANLCPYSFLHMFSFPRQSYLYFQKYALFEEISPKELSEWSFYHLQILKKATIFSGGAPLVLKNPAHSGRLPTILDIFPEAKFIHLVRNPYDVFLSMRQLYKVVLPRSQLQKIQWEQVEDNILKFYSRLMTKFLDERHLIPSKNLIEVKFEDLESTPLETIRSIYAHLELPAFMEAESHVKKYLETVANYRKNQYHLTADVIARVNQNWEFAFKTWGYEKI